jgi:hypothetical protein
MTPSKAGGHRQRQMPADDLGSVPNRHTLLADPVQSRARWSCFQGQPDKWAASSRCTAGQRLDPSPGYADTPLARAMSMRRGTKP